VARRKSIWLVAASVVVSACVGAVGDSSTSSSVVAASTTTTLASAAATTEFINCMAEEGVEVGELPFDANGRPRLEMLARRLDYTDLATVEALSICASFLSEGALDLGYDDQYREAVVNQLSAFSRCVRARGVDDFPDPIPGFLGIGSPYPVAEIPYNDPDLPGAVNACERTVFGTMGGAGG
jgi:hypothetical protein